MLIVVIIISIIIIYCLFSKIGDKIMDNMGITDDKDRENGWYTIGMFADMHNKRNNK